jgi:hypothetical protein
VNCVFWGAYNIYTDDVMKRVNGWCLQFLFGWSFLSCEVRDVLSK